MASRLGSVVLLAAAQKGPCELAYEVTGATASMSTAAVRLLSASEKLSSELADEVIRPAVSSTTAMRLFAASRECIQSKALAH
jgi:hypothetical protein